MHPKDRSRKQVRTKLEQDVEALNDLVHGLIKILETGKFKPELYNQNTQFMINGMRNISTANQKLREQIQEQQGRIAGASIHLTVLSTHVIDKGWMTKESVNDFLTKAGEEQQQKMDDLLKQQQPQDPGKTTLAELEKKRLEELEKKEEGQE